MALGHLESVSVAFLMPRKDSWGQLERASLAVEQATPLIWGELSVSKLSFKGNPGACQF